MILIADSSALVALAIVDKLEVLETLFGRIFYFAMIKKLKSLLKRLV